MPTDKERQKRQTKESQFRAFSTLVALFKFSTDSFGAFLSFVPPLNAAITGAISLLELGESLFLSEEDKKRKAIKVATSMIGTGLMIAAAVLIFNPTTAPIAAALLVGSIAISTIREGYLWYRKQKDLDMSVKELNQLILQRKSEQDPLATKALNEKIATVEHHIHHCQLRIRTHKTGFFYNAVSFAGAFLLTVAAFALVGAIVSNPIGLGIAGVLLLGAATAYSIKQHIEARRVSKAVKPLLNTESIETPHEPFASERTSQIAQHLAEKLKDENKITPEQVLKSDIADLQEVKLSLSTTENEDTNTLNKPLLESESPSTTNENVQDEDHSEDEGEGVSTPKFHH